MKKILLSFALGLAGLLNCAAENSIKIMDHVSFYDGYLVGGIPQDAPDQGCLRIFTYLNSIKLTDEQLNQIGQQLKLEVIVHAVCDNYDRIGSVNLAFLPKGTESYQIKYKDEEDPMRIEIARFITPFMDKNKEPSEVPYTFIVDNLSPVFRSQEIRDQYDIWLELEIFGVPYAANQQIAGCAGCNHVFDGSVSFITDDEGASLDNNAVFLPIVTRRSEWRGDRGMNNYNAAGTDELGLTIKSYSFELNEDVPNGQVVIMMSNHGAGTNGEEYVRRMHYAFLEEEEMLQWKPGRTTCEPYRMYNTQANGIYGYRERSDAAWQSFSNWCPGAPIPYQSFQTGPLSAGKHTVTISVPDAEFYGSDGYFPVSMYFQANRDGADIPAPIDLDTYTSGRLDVFSDDYITQVRVEDGSLLATSAYGIYETTLYTVDGQLCAHAAGNGTQSMNLNVSGLPRGIYVAVVRTSERVEAHKLAL